MEIQEEIWKGENWCFPVLSFNEFVNLELLILDYVHVHRLKIEKLKHLKIFHLGFLKEEKSCNSNLVGLELNNHPKIFDLALSNTGIASLDFDSLDDLRHLFLSDEINLSKIDLSNQEKLETITITRNPKCTYNQLFFKDKHNLTFIHLEIDLPSILEFSNQPDLEELKLEKIVEMIDISKNTNIKRLKIVDTEKTQLIVNKDQRHLCYGRKLVKIKQI